MRARRGEACARAPASRCVLCTVCVSVCPRSLRSHFWLPYLPHWFNFLCARHRPPPPPVPSFSHLPPAAYPASPTAAATDSQPFSEEETRALIRIRQEMDAAFLSNSRKRGLFTLYHAVADRLYGMGGGAWPKRPHHTVAQRWNNIVGSYKVRACSGLCVDV